MEYFSQISTYIITLGLAAIIPGPGMTGLMFKTLAKGYKNGLVMLLGLITGDLIFLSFSVLAISYIKQFNPNISSYIVIISCFYLFYISYKFWIFNENLIDEKSIDENPSINAQKTFPAYQDGLLITLSNPKTIAFYLALVPTIFGVKALEKSQLLFMLFPITILTLLFIGSIYIFFSWKMKQILKHQQVQQLLLKSLSLFMCFLATTMLYNAFS